MNTYVIRGYGAGELRIDDTPYHGAVLLSAATVGNDPETLDFSVFMAIDSKRILALDPELVLLGTGPRQIFPAAAFGAQFLRLGIGFEVMDTGAACRTFNVLVAEQRRVVAWLFLP